MLEADVFLSFGTGNGFQLQLLGFNLEQLLQIRRNFRARLHCQLQLKHHPLLPGQILRAPLLVENASVVVRHR